LFTLPAAKKVGEGKVFSFEPCAWTHERLLRNTRLNELRNVVAIQAALGERAGEVKLRVNVRLKDGLNTVGRACHEDAEVTAEEVVAMTTVDAFVETSKVGRVDVMKVDVEGGELLVFRGAEKLLSREDAPLILYESGFLSRGFDYHPVEQMWLLSKHGYTFFVMDSRTGALAAPENGHAYNSMVIAVKPSHPAFSLVREHAR
jgi:FkbM family methyltransferase